MNRLFLVMAVLISVFGLSAPAVVLAVALDDVVVTATRSDQARVDAPAGTTVITREQIERQSGAENIGDILRFVPGISVFGQGREGRSTISVRGLDSKHTLILLDGRRLPNTDAAVAHSDFRSQPLPLVAIERIEVVRAPMSGLYGSDALGGVINIITRQGGETPAGGMQLRGGTAETGGDAYRGSLSVSGSLTERVRGLVALEHGDRQAVPLREDRRVDEIEARRHTLGFARGQVDLTDNQNLSLQLRKAREDRTSRLQPGARREQDVDLQEIALGWDGQFGAARLMFDLYENRADVNYHDPDNMGRAPTRLRDRVADTRAVLPWWQSHVLTLGFEFRHERFDSDNLPAAESAHHRQWFVQNQSGFFNERLLLTAGFSVLDHNRFGSEVSPRVSTSLRLAEGWRLKAGYGEAFAVPTLQQGSASFHSIGVRRPFDLIGNPDLEPEESKGYELGVIREGQRLSGGVVLFRNNVDNLIDTVCVSNCSGPPFMGPPRVRQYVNIDSARTEGVESFLTARPGHDLRATLSHTWLRAKNRVTDISLEGRPRHNATLNLGWDPLPWLELDFDVQYVGRQLLDGETVSGYTLFGLRGRTDLGDGLSLTLGMENLTDVRLVERDDAFNYHERGRFVFATIDYRFGDT